MRDPYLLDNWNREYYEEEPLPLQCMECTATAVRLSCNAHGYPARTHPHGGIHKIGQGQKVYHYCSEHGRRHIRLNEAIIARKRMEA